MTRDLAEPLAVRDGVAGRPPRSQGWAGFDAKALGRRLAALRRRRGLTQEQLAERAGLSVCFVAQIERADRLPSLVSLARLAHALSVRICELLVDHDGGHGGSEAGAFGRVRERLTPRQREKLDSFLASLVDTDPGDAGRDD